MKRFLGALLCIVLGFAACYVWMRYTWQASSIALTAKTDTIVVATEARIDTVRDTVRKYLTRTKDAPPPAADTATLQLAALRDSLVARHEDTSSIVPIMRGLAVTGDSLHSCRETVVMCEIGLKAVDSLQTAFHTERTNFQAKLAEKNRRAWMERLKDVGVGVLVGTVLTLVRF